MQLGICWIGLKQYSKAENILLECFAKVRDSNGEQKEKVILSIVQLYNKWNKPNQADEFAIYLADNK